VILNICTLKEGKLGYLSVSVIHACSIWNVPLLEDFITYWIFCLPGKNDTLALKDLECKLSPLIGLIELLSVVHNWFPYLKKETGL
jgi:hypothetical protein